MSAKRKPGRRGRKVPPASLRETALVRYSAKSPVRGVLDYIGRILGDFAPQLPVEDLGESLERAELRAAAADLRGVAGFLGEIARRPAVDLPPADSDLCAWAAELSHEVARIAARIVRRLGPAPALRDPFPDP
ncbi:MAG TPA: hypothetical protein VN783_05960 [Thermoanaerobaculia bacterium]|nr:hypothetical protein [Thermoanaerobaculia bacterium]